MSTMFLRFLERLTEMFPEQGYQQRLEQYLSTKCIQSAADFEFWQREYDKKSDSNFV